MKTIKVQKLSRDAFHKFGDYVQLIDPMDEPATGDKNAVIAFFRDMLPLEMGGSAPCFSTCRIQPRPMIVDAAEFHNYTCEGSMPLDQDAVVWVAPASAGSELPSDEVEAFLVPQGTLIKLRPGVWHHAAFATENKALNMMIVLPERTYANDVWCIDVPADQQVAVEF